MIVFFYVGFPALWSICCARRSQWMSHKSDWFTILQVKCVGVVSISWQYTRPFCSLPFSYPFPCVYECAYWFDLRAASTFLFTSHIISPLGGRPQVLDNLDSSEETLILCILKQWHSCSWSYSRLAWFIWRTINSATNSRYQTFTKAMHSCAI